jgi:hypothetical protein
MNGLRMNGFHVNDLSEADSDNVMTYLVGCALRPDQPPLTIYDVSGPTAVAHGPWYGALGLAPELETEALSDVGQRWVSACMLAHANSIGRHVTISVRGGVLTSDDGERTAYSDLNGAFWGNLFTEPAELYACTPAAYLTVEENDRDTSYGRDCAIPYSFGLSHCFLTVAGECSDSLLCSSPSQIDGSYPACDGTQQVITVFLPPVEYLNFPPPEVGYLGPAG